MPSQKFPGVLLAKEIPKRAGWISHCWFSHTNDEFLFSLNFISFTLFECTRTWISTTLYSRFLIPFFSYCCMYTHHNLFCRIYYYSVVGTRFYICNLLKERKRGNEKWIWQKWEKFKNCTERQKSFSQVSSKKENFPSLFNFVYTIY